MKSTKPFMEQCFLCKSEFQMGGGEFLGYFIKYYGVTVCRGCFRGAKDGWPASAEVKLIPHLKELGKAVPERNVKGLLPRDA
ncbi:MAG: hypothetical protein ABL894_08045 [Hyphomicrobium sp.]